MESINGPRFLFGHLYFDPLQPLEHRPSHSFSHPRLDDSANVDADAYFGLWEISYPVLFMMHSRLRQDSGLRLYGLMCYVQSKILELTGISNPPRCLTYTVERSFTFLLTLVRMLAKSISTTGLPT